MIHLHTWLPRIDTEQTITPPAKGNTHLIPIWECVTCGKTRPRILTNAEFTQMERHYFGRIATPTETTDAEGDAK